MNNMPQFPKVLASYSTLDTLYVLTLSQPFVRSSCCRLTRVCFALLLVACRHYYNNSVTEVARNAPLPSSLKTLYVMHDTTAKLLLRTRS